MGTVIYLTLRLDSNYEVGPAAVTKK